MKYVIIGGVAGGATAAARLRRLDENCEIVMFEKGEHISYANCGLPYYIGDTITEKKNLLLQTPVSFGNRYDVDVRVRSEVTAIHPEQKTVSVRNLLNNKEYEENYDKLILSPGALPVVPPIPGIDSNRIFTLRNVLDTERIKQFVTATYSNLKEVVVVGAGFIGLEMVENLHQIGYHVTIVEKAPQVMTVVDAPIAAMVHKQLKDKNINVLLQTEVTTFDTKEDRIQLTLSDGKQLEADFVILSIGVRPNTSLAANAGLKIGQAGGIWVNEYLQTSNPDIYALGDAIEFPHPLSKIPYCCYLAGPANRQARICADNIVLGNKEKYPGSITTAIAKVFDLTVGSAGLSEHYLQKNNIPYLTSITHPFSHATYYPGAKQMSIKINFAPESGQLLGAQLVGAEGVDKRLDMMASVMSRGGSVYDLIEIEHAYAPPYSSAKDPVAYAGYVAENILTKRVVPVQWHELKAILYKDNWQDEYFLLDVRSAMEVKNGMIEGAVNYPVDELREFVDDIPQDKKIIIYCAVGLRGYIASRILMQSGFEQVYNLSGGYKTFRLMTETL
ncbi:MAG: FAD-dependent oxidoreductase [Bacteroidales bacterium]|nr:FAD-dependent oxidoreductase [Bacteroidales bacterium]